MMAVCVDPARINEVWPHFKHWIKAAIDKIGVSDWTDVEQSVISGKRLMWLAWDGKTVHAAAVTELGDGYCTILACGGKNLKLFLPLINDLEQFARNEKCTGVRVMGRRGWIRVLKNYKEKAVLLERRL
jgi:hypothetical protein